MLNWYSRLTELANLFHFATSLIQTHFEKFQCLQTIFLAQVEPKSRKASLAISLQVLRPICGQDDHSDYEKL